MWKDDSDMVGGCTRNAERHRDAKVELETEARQAFDSWLNVYVT